MLRPTGSEAIEALVAYVGTLGDADLPPVQVTQTRAATWDCRPVRPVSDYIHGLYCHITAARPKGAVGPKPGRITVRVSQYLINCPVAGSGDTGEVALAALKLAWGTLEAARAAVAAAGWADLQGHENLRNYNHP